MNRALVAVVFCAVCFGSMLLMVSSPMVVESVEAPERKYIRTLLLGSVTGLSLREEIRLVDIIMKESRDYGLDPLLVMALIEIESSYYNWSKSRNGAIGLMQVLPNTAAQIAKDLSIEYEGERTLYDPYVNIKMGIYYLAFLEEKFSNTGYAVAAYNNGPTRVQIKINYGHAVPEKYKNKVYAKYRDMQEKAYF